MSRVLRRASTVGHWPISQSRILEIPLFVEKPINSGLLSAGAGCPTRWLVGHAIFHNTLVVVRVRPAPPRSRVQPENSRPKMLSGLSCNFSHPNAAESCLVASPGSCPSLRRSRQGATTLDASARSMTEASGPPGHAALVVRFELLARARKMTCPNMRQLANIRSIQEVGTYVRT